MRAYLEATNGEEIDIDEVLVATKVNWGLSWYIEVVVKTEKVGIGRNVLLRGCYEHADDAAMFIFKLWSAYARNG